MIEFLTVEIITRLHKEVINDYGGSHGIRSVELLESALAQPEATFGGEYLHENIFEMTAAYGYHLCKNHPFVDGNKRIALVAIYTFLRVNGWELRLNEKQVFALMMKIANAEISKKGLTKILKEHTDKIV